MPDTRQDADLLIRIPAHSPDGMAHVMAEASDPAMKSTLLI